MMRILVILLFIPFTTKKIVYLSPQKWTHVHPTYSRIDVVDISCIILIDSGVGIKWYMMIITIVETLGGITK
jgi:hypothetical protein